MGGHEDTTHYSAKRMVLAVYGRFEHFSQKIR